MNIIEEIEKGRIQYTTKEGISYFKKRNKYYKTSGWLNHEISKEEFYEELRKEVDDHEIK